MLFVFIFEMKFCIKKKTDHLNILMWRDIRIINYFILNRFKFDFLYMH